jgi:hypothetical protein
MDMFIYMMCGSQIAEAASHTQLYLREVNGSCWRSLWSMDIEGCCDLVKAAVSLERRSLNEARENSVTLAEIEAL